MSILLMVLLAAGLSDDPEGKRPPPPECGSEACAQQWDCWTVSVTYHVNIGAEGAQPVYSTRFIEFLHEPGNVWARREDAECHARVAAQKGIMRPLNFPDNDQRVFIPPSAIDNVRVWKIPMPD